MTSRDYPENYLPEVVSTLEKATFSKGKDLIVLGSGALREMKYSADIDGYERTKIKGRSRALALQTAARRFKSIIRSLLSTPLTYITDCKAGSIQDWVVIDPHAHISKGKVLGYSAEESKAKVKHLYEKKVITDAEYKNALELLVPKPTPLQFLNLKDELRFNLIRWSIDELLAGKKEYRGRKVTLAEAFGQPAIIKLDLVTLAENNRFVEVSVIYELLWEGGRLNDFGMPNVAQDLRTSIYEYWKGGKVFKMSKRLYSLARFLKKTKLAKSLLPFLNSDLGLLYTIASDLDTLVLLVETQKSIPEARIVAELKRIPYRLGNISDLKGLLEKEDSILAKLKTIESDPKNIKAIDDLSTEMKRILNSAAKTRLEEMNLYPPPAFALP